MKISRKILLILAFAVIFSTFAQGTAHQNLPFDKTSLELEECIELALNRNYGLLMRKEALTRSAATRLGSWSQLMPSASVRYSWSHSGDERYNVSETGVMVSNDYYSMGFSASQPLFAGGSKILSLKTSYLNYRSSEADLRGETADLIYEVKQAFYTAISASQTVDNVVQSLERTREQWRFVAQRDTLGLADPTEVSQMKVTLAEAELSHLQAKNAKRQAEESLFSILALPVYIKDVSLIEPVVSIREPEDLDYFIDKALESNPQIKAAELARFSAKLNRFSAWSDYLPSVNASYSYNWSDNQMPSDFGEITDDASWSVGVSASWSLFTGTSRISSIRSANSSERDAELTLKQAKQLIETSVRRAYRTMEEAVARSELAKARLEDAQLNATLFREKYEIGNCTLLELLQAELSLQNAEAEEVQAIFDYRIAMAELERLSGVDLEE